MRVDQRISFVHFTLPFLFEPSEFERRKDAFEKASMKAKDGRTYPVWEKTRFPSDDLLEHVRNYLNPPEGKPATAHLWKLDENLTPPIFFATSAQKPFQYGEEFVLVTEGFAPLQGWLREKGRDDGLTSGWVKARSFLCPNESPSLPFCKSEIVQKS